MLTDDLGAITNTLADFILGIFVDLYEFDNAGATHVYKRLSPHLIACVPLVALLELSGRVMAFQRNEAVTGLPVPCYRMRVSEGKRCDAGKYVHPNLKMRNSALPAPVWYLY